MKGTTYREEEISEYVAPVLQRLDTCTELSIFFKRVRWLVLNVDQPGRLCFEVGVYSTL